MTVVTFLMLPSRIFAAPSAPADASHVAPKLSFILVPESEESPASDLRLIVFTSPTDPMAGEPSADEDYAASLASTTFPSDYVQLPDETPPGAKVPEPASMMLVGSGLLALARASRIKRPRWTLSRAKPVAMECAVSRETHFRQAA